MVRIGGHDDHHHVYQINPEKGEPCKTTFSLTEDYGGETAMELEVWVLKEQEGRRKKIPVDTRSTSELVGPSFTAMHDIVSCRRIEW